MPRDDHSVFISYRRDSGAEIARLLQAFLEQHGFRVFLDVDELDAGHFDAQLLRQIEQCDSFLMICSPGCLDRCANPDDWVRREIAQAIRCRRQIIPIALPGFAWPSRSSLPGEIAEFTQHNAFEYSHAHWRQASHRLLQMLHARGAGGGHAPFDGAANGRDATSAHEAELSVGDRLAVHRAREYERTLERTPGPERARVIAEALTATKVLPESEAARREVVCLRASLGLELGDASELPQLLVDLMDSRVFAAPSDRQLALIVKLERTLATRSPESPARERAAHAPAASAASGMPVWATRCLVLTEKLGVARAKWLRLTSPDPDESEIEDALSIALPLKLDSSKDAAPCRALLTRGIKLDAQTSSFAIRLRDAVALVSKVPAPSPNESDGDAAQLFAAHLLNLSSVLRLYVELQEAPDDDLEEYIDRAERIAHSNPLPLFSSDWTFELVSMLELSLHALTLEVQLAADLPNPAEVAAALRRGSLAYSESWRARLKSADEMMACAKRFYMPAEFSGRPSLHPGTLEFTRLVSCCEWLQIACEALRTPDRYFPLLIEAWKPRDCVSWCRHDDYGAVTPLVARGAWRTLDVILRIDPERDVTDHGFQQLISACLAPFDPIEDDGFWETQVWHPPKSCPSPMTLLGLLRPHPSTYRNHGWTPRAIASLLILASADHDRMLRLRALAPPALEVLAQQCVRRGSKGRKYWRPPECAKNSPTRTAIWTCLITALAEDARYSGDALVAATALDPDREALPAGLHLHQRLFGEESSAVMREKAAAALQARLRFRWLPWRLLRVDATATDAIATTIREFRAR